MKSSYLVIVLLLSDITLTSGNEEALLLGGAAVGIAFLGVFIFAWSQYERDGLLPFNSNALQKELQNNLYGQHIVSGVVLKSVSAFMTDNNPNKPLVLSFHGSTGVGKNHVAKLIARSIYEKGEHSKHLVIFTPEYHFPSKDSVDIYSAQLRQLIYQHVSSFPRTMFVFDEMDKMNPRLIETITPLLDYTAHIDGVSYRKAIFIFLSNAGGDVINNIVLDFWRVGENREKLEMNSHGMENKIRQSVFDDENSGFWHSSLLKSHLVDYFIPFLPLELKQVHRCVVAEMVKKKIPVDYDLAETVARDLPYFPPGEYAFSEKGCKTVEKKLVLYLR